MRGRFDSQSGEFRFMPDRWVDRPAGYQALGFEGELHANGLSIQGDIRGCLGPNSGFVAERADAAKTLQIDTAATERDTGTTGGRWQGVWEGAFQCKERIGPLAYRLTLLQHGDDLAAAYSLDWPGRSGVIQRRGIASGRVSAEGRLSLGHRLWLDPGRWGPEFEASGDGDVDQLIGDITGGMPANYGCERVTLNRIGDAKPPDLADIGLTEGVWGGYLNIGNQGRIPTEQWSIHQHNGSTQQVTLSFAREAGSLYGRFAGAAPIMQPPPRQDRYAYRLQPLVTLSDGRVAFVPLGMQRAEGRFAQLAAWYASRPYIALFAITEQGALEVTRLDAHHREVVYRLPRLEGEALDAIQQGEAPSVPLGGAIQGALSHAPSLDRQCRILQEWAAPVIGDDRLGGMTSRQIRVAMLPIVEDAIFEPVFGLPLSLTTEEERTTIHTLSRVCTRRTGDRDAEILIGEFRSDIHFDRLLALAMDRAESTSWVQDAMAEIMNLEDRDGSLSRLTAIESDARGRRSELSESDQDRLGQAITAKRRQIAVAKLMRTVDTIPDMPDEETTIDRLARLFDDASRIGLPPKPLDQLVSLSTEKAKRILQPLLQRAEASLDDATPSLDSLATLTSLERKIARLRHRLPPAVMQSTDFRIMSAVAERRRALIQHADVQQAFQSTLLALEPGRDNPSETVRRTALRYVDAQHLEGSSTIARTVQAATERLELRSIGLVDRSTQQENDSPSAQAMYFAVKAKFDQINDSLSTIYERCQRRQFQNDPMMAMTCLAVLTTGGGQELRTRITRFEKLGCARGEGQAGFVCDYVLGFETNSLYLRDTMLGELMGMGEVSQGRFVPISSGWLFTPLRQAP